MDQPERVRYFDQQFLRVDDFSAEQDYHRDMRRRHNRMLHTPGIAEGLLLVADGTGVKVTPGSAIPAGSDGNGGGAEIVLAAERRQELSSLTPGADAFITIAFAQEQAREKPDAGVTGFTRWRENPLIEAFTNDPTATPPTNPAQPLRVLLGRVSRGGATGRDVVAIDGSGRRLAGAAESEVSLTPRDPAITEPDWVRLRWLARGQAELRGDLKLVASQSTPGSLSVAGRATVSGELAVSAKATLGGELAVTGKATVGGELAVTGKATVSGELAVSKKATLGGELAVTAKATLGGELAVTGKATLGGELTVAGRTTLSSDLTVGGATATGALTVGSAGARRSLTVFGETYVNRAMLIMGNTDGGGTTAGRVIGGLGFIAQGAQGQLSFRAGSGFEFVDCTAGSPSLEHTLDQYAYADLRVRDLYSVRGVIRPSAGTAGDSGILFPRNLGGGSGDEGFIRYFHEGNEATTLLIGCDNDANDRVELWQMGARRLSVYNGMVGIGTREPSRALDVAGDIALHGKLAVQGFDTYLRLNQELRWGHGVHTPGNLTAGSLNIGGRMSYETAPGYGNIWLSGALTANGNVTAANVTIGDIGYGGDWAGFRHQSLTEARHYGLLQSRDGRNTLINKRSGGGRLEFRVDNDNTRFWMDDGGDMWIQGRLGVNGNSPVPRTYGWGGGIHAFDIEAEGTMWSRSGYQSGPRDLAENFACDAPLEPGDVVVLDRERDVIVRCEQANDAMVLGVVSELPGVLLGAGPDEPADVILAPVALAGRVACKVTTANGPIVRGALLTASSEVGRAMCADPVDFDGAPVYRTGTIIGKALQDCDEATGTIDILVLSR